MLYYNLLTEKGLPSIIEGINLLGEESVDWLSEINIMLSTIGLPGVVIVLWAIMPLLMTVLLITIQINNSKQSKSNNAAFSKQIENLTSAITILTDKVSSPYLETRQSIVLFRAIMAEHVNKKLNYLGDVLTKNDIHNRRNQIEKNISRNFKRITAEETEKLSGYKCVCGDMGRVVNNVIKWPKLLDNVYDIFFTEDKNHQKIIDIKTLLNAEVDNIARILEDNGVRN